MNAYSFSFLQSHPVFTTRDFSLNTNTSASSASRSLSSMAKANIITRITRNVWVNTKHPEFHPFICVFYLLHNEIGYISFLSALHTYGILSQIPRTIQVATTGHARKLVTPIVNFEFFQLKPELMREGITQSDSKFPYNIATPEKALWDTCYLSSRKNNRFSSLPELEFTRSNFSKKNFKKLFDSIEISAPIKSYMKNSLFKNTRIK